MEEIFFSFVQDFYHILQIKNRLLLKINISNPMKYPAGEKSTSILVTGNSPETIGNIMAEFKSESYLNVFQPARCSQRTMQRIRPSVIVLCQKDEDQDQIIPTLQNLRAITQVPVVFVSEYFEESIKTMISTYNGIYSLSLSDGIHTLKEIIGRIIMKKKDPVNWF